MGDLRIAPIAPPTPAGAASTAPAATGDTGFGEALSRALSEVNEMQLQSRDAAVAVASGKPVDTAQMVPVMYAVASVLILVTLLVVYADIVKPVTLGG